MLHAPGLGGEGRRLPVYAALPDLDTDQRPIVVITAQALGADKVRIKLEDILGQEAREGTASWQGQSYRPGKGAGAQTQEGVEFATHRITYYGNDCGWWDGVTQEVQKWQRQSSSGDAVLVGVARAECELWRDAVGIKIERRMAPVILARAIRAWKQMGLTPMICFGTLGPGTTA